MRRGDVIGPEEIAWGGGEGGGSQRARPETAAAAIYSPLSSPHNLTDDDLRYVAKNTRNFGRSGSGGLL
jgi:hypothetical protein